MENCGKIWKIGQFLGRLWPDWGYTAWAAMAGSGPIGLTMVSVIKHPLFFFS